MITLQVNGRKLHFKEKVLFKAIVEKLFSMEEIKKIAHPVPPTEYEWFQVFPMEIDPNLFKDKREDEKQEETRQIILEALEELKKYPEKYGMPFETIVQNKSNHWEKERVSYKRPSRAAAPTMTSEWITIKISMKDFINRYSFGVEGFNKSKIIFMINWVQQAFEWAQRISNGESWEDVCNKEGNIKYERLIIWKNEDEYAAIGSPNSSTKVRRIFKCKDNKLIHPDYQPVPVIGRNL